MKTMSDEWRKKYNKMYSDACTELRNTVVKWIEEQLLKAKESYYNGGSSYMDDDSFDALEHTLRMNDPNNKLLEKVGN